MKKYFSATFYMALLALGITSCSNKNAAGDATAKSPLISDSTLKLLKTDTVRLLPVNDEVKLNGEVSFDENKVVKVYPFSSGQVLTTNVSVGDYVKAGETLATIKSADIAGNYSDLAVAGNDVSIARRNMENAEHLYNNGIASQKEFVEAKENYDKAVSAAGKIKTQIQINGGGRTSSNGTYLVTSPRSGYVLEKLINPGNFIRNDNNSNMFTIGDISDVWIWANVFETDVAKVKEGYKADITTVAYPDSVFTGKVDKVNEVLDPITKMMRVKIVLANKSGLLKPEMFANIVISNSSGKQVIAVPANAIVSENGKNYVVVFNNSNDIKVQEIEVLRAAGDFTYIKGGVSPGQKVITENEILVYNMLMEK